MSQLKRIRETIDTTLATLGGLRAEVERLEAAFDAITGVVEVAKRVRRKRQVAKAAPNGAAKGGGITAAILGVFNHGNTPLDVRDIAALLPSLKDKSIYNALTVMVKKKLLKRTGKMGSYKYSKR